MDDYGEMPKVVEVPWGQVGIPRIKRVKDVPSTEDLRYVLLTVLAADTGRIAERQALEVGKEMGLKGNYLTQFSWKAGDKAKKDIVELMREIWKESNIIQAE